MSIGCHTFSCVTCDGVVGYQCMDSRCRTGCSGVVVPLPLRFELVSTITGSVILPMDMC